MDHVEYIDNLLEKLKDKSENKGIRMFELPSGVVPVYNTTGMCILFLEELKENYE